MIFELRGIRYQSNFKNLLKYILDFYNIYLYFDRNYLGVLKINIFERKNLKLNGRKKLQKYNFSLIFYS